MGNSFDRPVPFCFFDRHILGSDQLHFRLRLFKSDSIQRIPGIGLLQPCQFFICQTYKGIIRHSAFTETGRIAMASSLKGATILPTSF